MGVMPIRFQVIASEYCLYEDSQYWRVVGGDRKVYEIVTAGKDSTVENGTILRWRKVEINDAD